MNADNVPSETLTNANIPEEPLTIRLRDCARLLNLSQRTVWEMARRGEIPCFRLGSGRKRTYLFPFADLKEWVTKQTSNYAEAVRKEGIEQ